MSSSITVSHATKSRKRTTLSLRKKALPTRVAEKPPPPRLCRAGHCRISAGWRWPKNYRKSPWTRAVYGTNHVVSSREWYIRSWARGSPGDILRKSFHPRWEFRRASRALSLPSHLTRVFDIIEIPKAPGALQFCSIFLPFYPFLDSLCSRSASLIRATVCPPCLQSALSRPTLSPLYFTFVQNNPRWGGKWGRGLGGTGKPPPPDNLTEARWDKIASRWLGWCSCGSPYNSVATPSLHSVV